MSRPALTQRNPNRLAVQGLSINASIASVEILKALYTLKRSGWVRTPNGWDEGSPEEQRAFWEDSTPDTTQPTILEDHIMRRKDITAMDSIIAEAQVHRSGRWERTAMGGWRRLILDDKENTRSNTEAGSQTEQGDNTENDDTLVDGTPSDDSLLLYKGTKRSFDEYLNHHRPYPSSIPLQQLPQLPAQKKKRKPVDPSRVRPQPNVDMSLYDVSTISLPHETSESVPIFDTCDDVRVKIADLLTSSTMTRAAFMRLLCSAAFPTSKKGIQDRQLANFQAQVGVRRGCESNVYYAAYVYLEKLRVKRGEHKSRKRVEMEEVWGVEGVPRKIERISGGGTGKGDKMSVAVAVSVEGEHGVREKTRQGGGVLCENIAEKALKNTAPKAGDGRK
jgi:hypothetical protein